YPLEQGAFETYDKVAVPFEARVRFSAGGNVLDRQALLNSIAAIAGTTELFSVVTPEAIYPHVNNVHYHYPRAADKGGGLLAIDVFVRQVRIGSVPAFSNTAQPNGADQQSNGSVQTTAPTPTETSATKLAPTDTTATAVQ